MINEFLNAAFPWICLGLFIAVSCTYYIKNKGKEGNNKIKNKWFLVAAVCFYISAIILFITNGSRSIAVTNLCLGGAMLALSFSDKNKEKE